MLNHQHLSQAILQEIKQAENILIISHQRPDGDTLGSNLALRKYLSSLGKNVHSFCDSLIPDYLTFLPDSHLIKQDHLLFTKKFDLVITVDSATLELTGAQHLLEILPQPYRLINIDHHNSNPKYADINLVLSEACSTAEIIYRLFADWKITLDQDIATNLACGLITDTSGFKNPATSYQSLNIAAELFNQGANLHQLLKITNRSKNIDNLILWGRALERLEKIEKNNIVFTFLTQSDLLETNTDESAIEGIANFLHILKEGKIILVLVETSANMIKGSLRTTSEIDVSEIAKLFGGGGHKKAAGFTLPGKLDYVKNRIRII
ncbi:MAG: bifunctional oligoribonuclease/PAP phosphatase NrnA [Patescibacteria group bacterium]|jgi:phosphoesterase RecJ-like protein